MRPIFGLFWALLLSHFFSTRPLLDAFIHSQTDGESFQTKSKREQKFFKKGKKEISKTSAQLFLFLFLSIFFVSKRIYIHTQGKSAEEGRLRIYSKTSFFTPASFLGKERVELLFFFPLVFLKPQRGQRRDVVDGFFFFFGEGDFAAGKTRR